MKTISIIGLGYIGLPTAAMFAAHGVQVIGVDIAQTVVHTINRGETHLAEPGLEALVSSAVGSGMLRATTVVEASDAFLIAVPTPFVVGVSGNPEPNLEHVVDAANSIAPVLKKGDLIILESTIPIGVTQKLVELLSSARPDLLFPREGSDQVDIFVAHCPERVLPGCVLHELVHNDRVIGGITSRCAMRAVELYRVFVEGDCIVTNAKTAEMVKLVENSFRDVQIAFANELSLICDQINIDVWELISLANRHPRVNILQPGPGVGGHCIAVDPWFIVNETPDLARIIKMARLVNDSKPAWVTHKVRTAVDQVRQVHPNKSSSEVVVACLGLSFKADVDDLRESPALEIVMNIAKMHDCRVVVVEPNVVEIPQALQGRVELLDLHEAVAEAEIIVLLVDHHQFKSFDARKIASKVIDTRGIWSC